MKNRCYLCKKRSNSIIFQINNYKLVKCCNCDLVQTDLDDWNRERINKQTYNNDYLKNYLSNQKELKSRFYKHVINIDKFKFGGKILDIGCGTGLFLESVRDVSKYKWQLYGLEVNRGLLKAAKSRLTARFHLGYLSSAKYLPNYFDCIASFDVLEHDPKINKNLRKIEKLLKKNGLLVIQVPNYRSVMAHVCGQNWDWWSVPDHILHFSPSVLSKILIDNGFVIKRLFTWEPAKEFVTNIRGTFKKKVTSFIGLNRILSKLSIIPLYFLWTIVYLAEKRFNIGGLTVIYAVKNKI